MKLIIEDDEGRKTVVPFVRDEISIGREEGNTIRLTERNVSRRHACLRRSNGHIFIEDLGSYNGVRVNGNRVQGRAEIREGDLIEIGDYNLAVQPEPGEIIGQRPPPGEAAAKRGRRKFLRCGVAMPALAPGLNDAPASVAIPEIPLPENPPGRR